VATILIVFFSESSQMTKMAHLLQLERVIPCPPCLPFATPLHITPRSTTNGVFTRSSKRPADFQQTSTKRPANF